VGSTPVPIQHLAGPRLACQPQTPHHYQRPAQTSKSVYACKFSMKFSKWLQLRGEFAPLTPTWTVLGLCSQTSPSLHVRYNGPYLQLLAIPLQYYGSCLSHKQMIKLNGWSRLVRHRSDYGQTTNSTAGQIKPVFFVTAAVFGWATQCHKRIFFPTKETVHFSISFLQNLQLAAAFKVADNNFYPDALHISTNTFGPVVVFHSLWWIYNMQVLTREISLQMRSLP